MSTEKEFSMDEWLEKLHLAKTEKEIQDLIREIPLTKEEEEKLGSMTGDDPEYFFTERQTKLNHST